MRTILQERRGNGERDLYIREKNGNYEIAKIFRSNKLEQGGCLRVEEGLDQSLN